MTWKTQTGVRTLDQAEARVFSKAVLDMLEVYMLDPREGLNYNVPLTEGPFENLTTAQKLTVLEEVAEALLTVTPVPQLTAVKENAIEYVFQYLKQQFFDCLADAEDCHGRSVLDALGYEGRPKAPRGAPDAARRGSHDAREGSHNARGGSRDARGGSDDASGGSYDACGSVDASDSQEDDWDDEEDDYAPYIGCMDLHKWEEAIEELLGRILWDHDYELQKQADVPPPLWQVAQLGIPPSYFSWSVPTRKGAKDRLSALCARFC
eukprot:jgi/Botrbrau1/317/Bobra.0022s0279.1